MIHFCPEEAAALASILGVGGVLPWLYLKLKAALKRMFGHPTAHCCKPEHKE